MMLPVLNHTLLKSLANNCLQRKAVTYLSLNLPRWRFRPICHTFSTTHINHQIPPSQQSKALILLTDLKELRSSPRSALALGLAGLLPFVLPPLYFLSSQQILDLLVQSQLAYGAVILSFLGGIQCSYTILEASRASTKVNWRNLSQSVLPSVIAWQSLLMPTHGCLLALICGHSYTLYRDMAVTAYPPWFRGLRFLLSLMAIVALWTTFICTVAYEKSDNTGPENKIVR